MIAMGFIYFCRGYLFLIPVTFIGLMGEMGEMGTISFLPFFPLLS